MAGLGLKWLLGAMFGAQRGGSLDDAPELEPTSMLPRRGSIESERNRMAMQRNAASTERRMPRPAATPPAGTHRQRPVARVNDAPPREDWQVRLSSLQRGNPRSAAPAEGPARVSKWPAIKPSAEAVKARPESEWAAFESLRPTDAMLARATASDAISAASAAANASLSRAASPSAPQQHIPPSIARGMRISSVGRSPRETPPVVAGGHAEAVPTRLMRSLQEAMRPATPEPVAAPQIALPQVPEPPVELPLDTPAEVPVEAPVIASSPVVAPPAPPEPVARSPWDDIPAQEEHEPYAPFEPDGALSQTLEPLTPFELFSPAPPSTPAVPPAAFSVQAPAPAVLARMMIDDVDDGPRVDIPLPALELLDVRQDAAIEVDAEQLAETGRLIEQRLKEFKVPVTVLGAEAGPVITRFEVEPAQGVRGAQVVNLVKDLSRALGLTSIRVVETIPGKTCMGLELPNAKRQMIKLSEIVRSEPYRKSSSLLTLAMGKDITGIPVVTDLARAPHMLVAGTTGSGKSVAINAMILSLLYKATPDEVRLIMIDPKMLELSIYEGIPHLLAPVVTDMREAAHALNWAVEEMERRYKKMSRLGVRNLAGYNQKIDDAAARGEKIANPFSLTPDAPEPLDKLPTIVIVIDELADLMMVVGKKVEELIARLAQKARAAGVHLILATQRPSVDVITGLIKANIPTRVAFQVSSKIDSRTVLDQMGAESLLGHGDMLFLPPGSGYPQRVHGAFVSDEEVHRVVEYLKSFGPPQYIEEILAPPIPDDASQGDMFGGDTPDPEADPLYDEAVAFVLKSRRASISSVQRQLRIGYNRAARLVEQMETAGVLSAMSRNGSRDILVPPSGEE
ncbi:DNA translocase FtsK [Herbaspirillum sp. alder98]|uniref:DNA translocase FtsK n=1 Tax=Herbaspirillum sp. alder98 TaxID=2913096 RepID=UPI0039BCF601